MAKKNYPYEKRQKEIAKKKKKEEKRLKKLNRALGTDEVNSEIISEDAENEDETTDKGI